MGKPVKEELSEGATTSKRIRNLCAKKIQGVGKEVVASVAIQLVEELKNVDNIKDICKVLTIAPSTYYRWKAKTVCSDPVEKRVGELGYLSPIVYRK